LTREISVTVNNRSTKVMVREQDTLLTLVRETLCLTGTKEVCGIGECGACTVLKDGIPVSSCIELAIRADGCKIETIEGVAVCGELHPLQAAFVENSAFQCGYCTSGMVMTAKSLIESRRGRGPPDEAEVRDYMSGNLCRCTGYRQIVDAILQASAEFGQGVHG
jgi:aerobic-type carbon monoxide dehydrogenase small subunit (CoxS/CutS family)